MTSQCDISDITNGHPICYGNLRYTSELCYSSSGNTPQQRINTVEDCKYGDPGCSVKLLNNCVVDNNTDDDSYIKKCIKVEDCPNENCSIIGNSCMTFLPCNPTTDTNCFTITTCNEGDKKCKKLKNCNKDILCGGFTFAPNVQEIINRTSPVYLILKNKFYDIEKCAIASIALTLGTIFSAGISTFFLVLATIVFCTDNIDSQNYDCSYIYSEFPYYSNINFYTKKQLLKTKDEETEVDYNFSKIGDTKIDDAKKKCIPNTILESSCKIKTIVPSRDTLLAENQDNKKPFVILGLQFISYNNQIKRLSGICYTEYTNLFAEEQQFFKNIRFTVEEFIDIPSFFIPKLYSYSIDNKLEYPLVNLLNPEGKDDFNLVGDPNNFEKTFKKWIFPYDENNPPPLSDGIFKYILSDIYSKNINRSPSTVNYISLGFKNILVKDINSQTTTYKKLLNNKISNISKPVQNDYDQSFISSNDKYIRSFLLGYINNKNKIINQYINSAFGNKPNDFLGKIKNFFGTIAAIGGIGYYINQNWNDNNNGQGIKCFAGVSYGSLVNHFKVIEETSIDRCCSLKSSDNYAQNTLERFACNNILDQSITGELPNMVFSSACDSLWKNNCDVNSLNDNREECNKYCGNNTVNCDDLIFNYCNQDKFYKIMRYGTFSVTGTTSFDPVSYLEKRNIYSTGPTGTSNVCSTIGITGPSNFKSNYSLTSDCDLYINTNSSSISVTGPSDMDLSIYSAGNTGSIISPNKTEIDVSNYQITTNGNDCSIYLNIGDTFNATSTDEIDDPISHYNLSNTPGCIYDIQKKNIREYGLFSYIITSYSNDPNTRCFLYQNKGNNYITEDLELPPTNFKVKSSLSNVTCNKNITKLNTNYKKYKLTAPENHKIYKKIGKTFTDIQDSNKNLDKFLLDNKIIKCSDNISFNENVLSTKTTFYPKNNCSIQQKLPNIEALKKDDKCGCVISKKLDITGEQLNNLNYDYVNSLGILAKSYMKNKDTDEKKLDIREECLSPYCRSSTNFKLFNQKGKDCSDVSSCIGDGYELITNNILESKDGISLKCDRDEYTNKCRIPYKPTGDLVADVFNPLCTDFYKDEVIDKNEPTPCILDRSQNIGLCGEEIPGYKVLTKAVKIYENPRGMAGLCPSTFSKTRRSYEPCEETPKLDITKILKITSIFFILLFLFFLKKKFLNNK